MCMVEWNQLKACKMLWGPERLFASLSSSEFCLSSSSRIRFVGCLDFIVFIIFGCEQTIRLFASELIDVSMP